MSCRPQVGPMSSPWTLLSGVKKDINSTVVLKCPWCCFSGIYLTCTMAITTLSMVLTVFVLNLHHISDRPLPNWVRKLVLVYMARLLCMCSYDPAAAEASTNQASAQEEARKKDNKYRVNPNSLGKAIGNQIGLLASLNGTLGVNNSRPNQQDRYYNQHDRHAMHYRSQYTYGNEKKNSPDPKRLEEEWARDWRRVAEVVDRLFFWIFLSAIVITTLLLFHPLTKAYFSLLGDESVLTTQNQEGEEAEATW